MRRVKVALHRLVARLVLPYVHREVAAAEARTMAAIAAARQQAVDEAHARGRAALLAEPLVFGPAERLHVDATAQVMDALFNTTSGSIHVGEHAFFGHRVMVLTGTHETGERGAARQTAIPQSGHDVRIGAGAWLGSGATVLGPCEIGAHAVVAAGAVVTADVPAETMVGGVPARPL